VKSDFKFVYQHRVRWVECDPQWVVFNGHYLTFFDVAITEYLRAVGLPSVIEQQKAGKEFFARKASVEYHAPAQYDDVLDICVRVGYLGTSSLRLVLEIYTRKQLVTSGEMVYVCVDSGERVSTPLPIQWKEAVKSYEVLAPQESIA
jgi:acyl-CoA thioester hydrolase